MAASGVGSYDREFDHLALLWRKPRNEREFFSRIPPFMK